MTTICDNCKKEKPIEEMCLCYWQEVWCEECIRNLWLEQELREQ